MKRLRKHIALRIGLLALVAGLCAVLIHPVVHILDPEHHHAAQEQPHSDEDADCLECILLTSMSTDQSPDVQFNQLPSEQGLNVQARPHSETPSLSGLFLRGPPLFAV